jgi:hypothetical protein
MLLLLLRIGILAAGCWTQIHTVRLDVRVVGQVCKPPPVVLVSNMVGEPGLDFENSIPNSECQSVRFCRAAYYTCISTALG